MLDLANERRAFQLDYREVRLDRSFFLWPTDWRWPASLSRLRSFAIVGGIVDRALWFLHQNKFAPEVREDMTLDPFIFGPAFAKPFLCLDRISRNAGVLGSVGGAHLFVTAANRCRLEFDVSPLLLALLIAPLATELPEMSNSFLWLYQKKDTLAVGNVTGAMVFQGTFPVSVGLIGTNWDLSPVAMTTMGLALIAVGMNFVQLLVG